ncbi:unnamed protein product [Caenorhabditis auriculariae]|uniref:PH-15 domain-containing protein n=1 Tax=Caenorhabditis auriculariae TaxID=2777116 RepID=A0A8S1GYB9_9PELO|nr:unnamed protein product [Caenorhabditis auriculariae]
MRLFNHAVSPHVTLPHQQWQRNCAGSVSCVVKKKVGMGRWSQRFAVLTVNHVLYIYKSENDGMAFKIDELRVIKIKMGNTLQVELQDRHHRKITFRVVGDCDTTHQKSAILLACLRSNQPINHAPLCSFQMHPTQTFKPSSPIELQKTQTETSNPIRTLSLTHGVNTNVEKCRKMALSEHSSHLEEKYQ